MELIIDLEFSELRNEFRHNLIEQPTDDFKTVVEGIEYSEARRFIDYVRCVFPHPLIYVSVIAQWNVYRLKNNL